jgi:hypothetical protein
MISPVREVVQEAVAPARLFVDSVMPTMPSIFSAEPRQAIASEPSVEALAPGRMRAPISENTVVAVEDQTVVEVVAETTPAPQARAVAPLRSSPLAQPTPPSPEPSVVEPPVAAIERTLPVIRAAPAAAIVVPSGSRAEVGQQPAQATTVPVSTRTAMVVVRRADQRAAEVASPTSIPVAVPAVVVASQAPTDAPTIAPTQAATLAPPSSGPTSEPKKTAVPARTNASPAPAHAAPPATHEDKKDKPKTDNPHKPTEPPAHAAPPATHEDKKDKPKTDNPHKPAEPPGRPANAPPGPKHDGD